MNTIQQQHNTACPICFSVFEEVSDDAGNVTDYRCANTDCPNGRPIPSPESLAAQELGCKPEELALGQVWDSGDYIEGIGRDRCVEYLFGDRKVIITTCAGDPKPRSSQITEA